MKPKRKRPIANIWKAMPIVNALIYWLDAQKPGISKVCREYGLKKVYIYRQFVGPRSMIWFYGIPAITCDAFDRIFDHDDGVVIVSGNAENIWNEPP